MTFIKCPRIIISAYIYIGKYCLYIILYRTVFIYNLYTVFFFHRRSIAWLPIIIRQSVLLFSTRKYFFYTFFNVVRGSVGLRDVYFSKPIVMLLRMIFFFKFFVKTIRICVCVCIICENDWILIKKKLSRIIAYERRKI